VERSRATHQTIQQFYTGLAVEESRLDVRVPEPSLLESKTVYGQKVAGVVLRSAERKISSLEAQLTQ
jgi:hypothetical protein